MILTVNQKKDALAEKQLKEILRAIPVGYKASRIEDSYNLFLIEGVAAQTYYKGYVTLDTKKRGWSLGQTSSRIEPASYVGKGFITEMVEDAVSELRRIIVGHTKPKLTVWINEEHCSYRAIPDTDHKDVANRIAFIEKTPRIRIARYDPSLSEIFDGEKWLYGPKGCSPEYGQYQPSRDWCDDALRGLGYDV